MKIRAIAASAFLLVIFISGSILFFIHLNNSKTSHTTATPDRKKAAATTPTSLIPTVSSTPQPLFFDNFADASKGWSLGNASGYTRTIANNALMLAATNHKLLTESLPTGETFNDFTITVTFTLIQANQADSVGLYLRGDSYLDHDYRIDIYGNNTYAISKELLNTSKYPEVQFLVSPNSISQLKPVGQSNTLTVIMKGSTFVLLINGTVVNSITDSDYTNGQIALFVQNSNTSDGVEAAFSHIVVYPAPNQLPSR